MSKFLAAAVIAWIGWTAICSIFPDKELIAYHQSGAGSRVMVVH